MSTKAGKRPLRSLTAHEKLEAIRRVHDGESKASVARDIGVPESTLRGWCKNEEKISYISRQSSPDTDDSLHFEPKEKKAKLEDSASSPFNLSLKPNSRLSYSPNSELYKGEMFQKNEAGFKVEEKPLNLNVKVETAKTERERNRAELARLSIELGLNRPEMYPATAGNLDFTNINLLTQWNNLLMQQKPKKSSPDSSSVLSSPQTLLQNAYKTDKVDKTAKAEQSKTVEDSVWYWLKTQQAMLSLSQNQNLNLPTSTSQLPSNSNDQNSSWFWKWYKQYTQQLQTPQQTNDKILYQQLTKDKDSENFKVESDKPKSSNKARAVLDNLLLNNNNNVAVNKKDKEEDLSQSEALEHGEKFLKWLECCSEPSVTAMQIMQFRSLINNIKTGADRKNGEVQKAKVRRK